jgi:hypothetical protein
MSDSHYDELRAEVCALKAENERLWEATNLLRHSPAISPDHASRGAFLRAALAGTHRRSVLWEPFGANS